MKLIDAPSQQGIAQSFLDIYDSYVAHAFDQIEYTKLVDVSLRTCRYCGKRMPEVTFIKRPHTIPQFLGNKSTLSNEECDSCNHLFGTFERELGLFTNLDRTMLGIQGERGNPKFDNSTGSIHLRRMPSGFMVVTNVNGRGITFDKITGTFSIDVSQKRYRPDMVYKAFLKMALAIMPNADLPDLKVGFDYLLGKYPADALKDGRIIIISKVNAFYGHPLALIFKRKIDDRNYPMYMFCLYIGIYMYQFPVIFHNGDHREGSREIKIQRAPYLIVKGSEVEDVVLHWREFDLNANERTQPPAQTISGTLTAEQRQNLASIQMSQELKTLFNKFR